MSIPRKTERFQQIPIFLGMSSKQMGQILRIVDEVTYPAGKEIFREGDPPDGFYIILEGKVDIRLQKTGTGTTTIATLSDRSVFGEMSLLGKRPRSALAVAVHDTRLYKVRGEAFQALLDEDDLAAYKVVWNFAKLISIRLRRVEDELMTLLESAGPAVREAKLAELQQFRQTLFEDWNF